MDTVDLLSLEQLETLEARLREVDAPVIGRLQPGLSDADIDALTAPLGLELPVEARRFWSWHNGTVEGRPVDRLLGPLDLLFLTLEETVEICRSRRKIAEDVVPDRPEDEWRPAWFPLARHGNLAFDCGVPPGSPSPVWNTDPWVNDDIGTQVAASIGEVVGWWLEALDQGAWEYDARSEQWRRHFDVLPERLYRDGVI